MKRQQMPHVAKIKRDDPFRPADRREIDGMVRRIAGAGEHFSIAGWREEAGYLLFHFPTWSKARAMQHWIDRSGIAGRPAPSAVRWAADARGQRLWRPVGDRSRQPIAG